MDMISEEGIQKTGGPAFPVDETANVNDTMGMTLRDYFAGQALFGVATTGTGSSYETTARYCYKLADAMLKERSTE